MSWLVGLLLLLILHHMLEYLAAIFPILRKSRVIYEAEWQINLTRIK